MIALDLRQHHCQVLLITCLKFTKKECESCTHKKKKVMSECRFIDLENIELYYEWKECNDESFKSINELNKKFPNRYWFCNEDVNKFVL